MNPPSLFIDFQNVTVVLGSHVVLDSISIHIPDGEHVAIIGPNGSGKSSFIKTIVREHYPVYTESGSVFRIWGQDTWDVFSLRSHFGYVSQDLQFTLPVPFQAETFSCLDFLVASDCLSMQ